MTITMNEVCCIVTYTNSNDDVIKIWFRYNTRESNSETRDFTICKQTAQWALLNIRGDIFYIKIKPFCIG